MIFLAKIGSFLAVFMIFTEKIPKSTKYNSKNVTRETISLRFARFTADKCMIDLIRNQLKTMQGEKLMQIINCTLYALKRRCCVHLAENIKHRNLIA